MGCWRSALPIHPPADVCTCCWIWVEGSREVNSPQLLAGPPKAKFWGGHIHRPTGRVLDIQRRNWWPLPWSIHAQEVAQTPTVQAQVCTGGNEGHFVFLERPPKVEEREQSGGSREPEPAGTCPSCHCDRASQRERWDTLGKWELATVREAHQQALPAALTLEEWIERLSQSTTSMRPDICHCSQSQDWPRRRSQGQSWRCYRAMPEEGSQAQCPTHSPTGSHQRVTFLGTETSEEDQAAALHQYWSGVLTKAGARHQVLPAGVSCHAKRGQWEWSLAGAPSGGLQKVDWVEGVQGPHTWQVAGIDNFQELAQKVRASFEIPQTKSMAQGVDNNYLAWPAPKCICQKEFLPLLNLMFPSQDFREGQSKKTRAYAQGLQYWVEKANLPMPGWPHLLVGCVQELRQMMEPYVAITNNAILEGAAPQERLPDGWTWASIPVDTLATPIIKELEGIQVPELGVLHSTRNGGAHQRAGPCRGVYRSGGPHRGAHWGTGYSNGHVQQANWGARCPPCVAWGERKGRGTL